MERLLESVLDAHGSPRNWANVKKLTAKLSLGGSGNGVVGRTFTSDK